MIRTVYRALSLSERAADLIATSDTDLSHDLWPIVGELREQLRLLCSLTVDIEDMDSRTATIREDWSKV